MSNRPSSIGGRLARLGFADPARAARLMSDPALAGLFDPLDDVFEDGLLVDLAGAPDPDLALLGLLRLMEALRALGSRDPDDPEVAEADVGHLLQSVRVGGPVRDRLVAVLGSSVALGDHLARHPAHWPALTSDRAAQPDELRTALLSAVGADPSAAVPVAVEGGRPAYDRLRVAYRRSLLAVAGRDLASGNPSAHMPEVGRELADLAAAALEAALAIARAELDPGAARCRIAIIGMGKCGGRELNYVSDVDVIFVAEPAEPAEPVAEQEAEQDDARLGDLEEPARGQVERDALATAHQLAAGVMRACSAATPEGTLWPVDANLRPEGRDGPLVRTLASHLAYYERWAKTWEFQALLKARPVAGDTALGAAYAEGIAPLVWTAAERSNFVEDVQAMRRRVEENVPPDEVERQLKLGRGGLRDVEFSVQLLQLVHGRVDEEVRSPSTLAGLQALADGGYVGRDDAQAMAAAYRLLRTLEHRVQLYRLRRTHLMPTADADLRRLGRQLGHRADPARSVVAQWQVQAREVRRLHERLFYRPLLVAASRLSPDEVRMTPDAARSRLQALGYRDPSSALRNLAALTDGVSRRSAIQRQLLPVMLGWFADEADPDAGLLAFRRVSDELGATHWYLKMLRDEGSAAERLAHVLARGRFVADLLERAPDTVQVLGHDSGLDPRTAEALRTEIVAVVGRHDDPVKAVAGARAVRRRELIRIATADLLGRLDLDDVERSLTSVAAALLEGVLTVASRVVEEQLGAPLPTRLLVVGMGRFGGRELGYGSDADVMFVHDPLDGVDEAVAQEAALAVVGELRRLIGGPGPDPALELDADLRPEGKQGALVRSLASYAGYYERWSLVWESQALLRATPLAGDGELADRFRALIDPVRWPQGGLSEVDVREIRRVKARVESERLPRGGDPGTHLKLGRGGMADVEWTVQLLQLRHAHVITGLRHTGTMTALRVAHENGLVDVEDAEVLAQSWTLASRLRNAAVLWRGRPVDALPSDLRDLAGVARIVGYPAGSGAALVDDYRRSARRARSVVERLFYE
ncbi:bifunctional [glutamine synthetase] adenylyltransferase/[glutamine synthetase]-adenylyl-L-tyrosine phosphorylase [Angustibacter sp. McL0619]